MRHSQCDDVVSTGIDAKAGPEIQSAEPQTTRIARISANSVVARMIVTLLVFSYRADPHLFYDSDSS